MKKVLTVALLVASSFGACAHNITLGEPLPALQVADKGLINLVDDAFSYQDWSTDSLKGKVHVLQVMAGRTSSQALNAPMIDAIEAAQFSADNFKMVTLINTDDAIWGTSLFVKGAIEDNKRQYPDAVFVVDDNSDAHQRWELEPQSSAIIVVDKAGKVVYVNDGAMDAQQVTTAIALIKEQSQRL